MLDFRVRFGILYWTVKLTCHRSIMPAFARLPFARYRSIALALARTSRITTACCPLHKTHLLSLTTHYRKGYSPTRTPQSHLSSSVIYILIDFIDISTASVSYLEPTARGLSFKIPLSILFAAYFAYIADLSAYFCPHHHILRVHQFSLHILLLHTSLTYFTLFALYFTYIVDFVVLVLHHLHQSRSRRYQRTRSTTEHDLFTTWSDNFAIQSDHLRPLATACDILQSRNVLAIHTCSPP